MNRGFTLLEVLVALAVFAILATLTSSVMYHAFNTRTRIISQASRLNDVQLTWALINNDTRQLITRSIRGNNLQLISAFKGQPRYVEFTRGGEINPISNGPRSTLKRIAYLCQNTNLIRRSWDMLDSPNRQQYLDKVILKDLNKCQFAYLDKNKQILTYWQETSLQQDQRKESIPIAIQMNLTLNDWGAMSVLFIIPEALYGE